MSGRSRRVRAKVSGQNKSFWTIYKGDLFIVVKVYAEPATLLG